MTATRSACARFKIAFLAGIAIWVVGYAVPHWVAREQTTLLRDCVAAFIAGWCAALGVRYAQWVWQTSDTWSECADRIFVAGLWPIFFVFLTAAAYQLGAFPTPGQKAMAAVAAIITGAWVGPRFSRDDK